MQALKYSSQRLLGLIAASWQRLRQRACPALRDPRLATLVSMFAAEWEAASDLGRDSLEARFVAYFPELNPRDLARRDRLEEGGSGRVYKFRGRGARG